MSREHKKEEGPRTLAVGIALGIWITVGLIVGLIVIPLVFSTCIQAPS